MKKLSKVLVLVLSAIMVLAMSASVFAADITVTNVKKGETYTAYKILEYKSNSGNTAYSYYLETSNSKSAALKAILETAGFEFTTSADGTQYVLNETSMDANTIVANLKTAGLTEDNVLAYATATATSDGQAVFSGLAPGYWFVTSSMGSLCSLASYDDEALIVEKNTVPTVDKKEKTSGDDYVNGPVDAGIGDTVHYQIVVTDGTGTDQAITLTDTMSDGLDYTAGSLAINGTAVADDANTDNWKVTVSGRTITIVLKAAYVKTLDTGATVTVTYDATINENAVVDSADDNENKVVLTYSQQSSEDKVYVETYDFQLYKTDGTSFLDGAGFKLYDAATNGNQIKVNKDSTGYYVNTSVDKEIMVDSANGVNVRGLAPGTYYLEETTVPDGYNKLDARVAVTITTGATAPVEITVENEAGAVLPSTGGIGTTIFYILGSALVIGCGIVLISRKRMHDK